MTLRRLIPLALAAAGAVALVLILRPGPTPASAEGRPNIILIVTDDQSARQFSEQAMPRTRRIVADRGTEFTRFWVNTAQCCPSRATMLTGQYAHNTGIFSNRDGYPAMSDPESVLPAWLQRAGYNTSHVGKYLNGYRRSVRDLGTAPGWERWRLHIGPTYYGYDLVDEDGTVKRYGDASRQYSTTVLNRIAEREVARLGERDAPFFLQLDHRAPHTESGRDSGGRCGGLALPAPRDADRFEEVKVPRPPSFNEADVADKPAFIRRLPSLDERNITSLDKRWSCALATLAEVDRGVAGIASELRRLGELDETVIALVSDHGNFYGEHRIFKGKVLPYASASEAPFAIRIPGPLLDGRRAKRVGEVTGNVDLAPTLLELAGAEPCVGDGDCRTLDGRSLVPLIEGSNAWPRDRTMVLEYAEEQTKRYAVCEFTGIWSKRDVFTRYAAIAARGGDCKEVDIRERYDLRRDPYELRNLCAGGCPDGPRQDALESKLADLSSCAGIEGRDERVDGRPFCE